MSVLTGLVILAAPVSAARAAVIDVFYDRAFALAAHQKCDLFNPSLIAALDTATLQARGAALRAGASATDLMATAARAQSRMSAIPCSDGELRQMGTRVEAGFAGWSRAARMSFPGDRANWRGDRFSSKGEGWRLVQDGAVGGSPVRIGLMGKGPTQTSLTAVVSFNGRPRPYAARLVMRDPQLMPRAWVTTNDLPASVRRTFFATGVRTADQGLLVDGKSSGELWSFPEAAENALALLDPRESFVVEFLFRDDSIAKARFEAGDFAAGRAFLTMGPI